MADIKLNDALTVNGYVAGSYTYTKPTGGVSVDHFDVDNSLLLFKYTSAPVTGVVSFYYPAPADPTILDAYATYDAGNGVSFTGGNFLSYMGYESFFVVNNPTISFANGGIGAIPAYHSGVRVDYSDSAWSAGAAILDSVYNGTFKKGDGELKQGQGYEAFVAFKGVPDLTLWAGVAYDKKSPGLLKDVFMYDLWASYKVDAKTTVAAEYANRNGGKTDKGNNWLVEGTYAFTDKVSTALRVSGEKDKDARTKFVKYTVAPGIALTKDLTVRAEYSLINGSNMPDSNFFGVQAYVKF